MSDQEIELQDIADELIVLHKATFDEILKISGAAMQLYMFYYYTAKWQKTNQPKCTIGYAAKGLKESETWVRKNKKLLVDKELVGDIRRVDENNKVTGWYMKVNYILKKGIIATLSETHRVASPQSGKPHPNALSPGSINALSPVKEMLTNTPTKMFTYVYEHLLNKQPDKGKIMNFNTNLLPLLDGMADYQAIFTVHHLMTYSQTIGADPFFKEFEGIGTKNFLKLIEDAKVQLFQSYFSFSDIEQMRTYFDYHDRTDKRLTVKTTNMKEYLEAANIANTK